MLLNLYPSSIFKDFSGRNDAVGNVIVMIAAVGVWGTATAWPDLIVAGIMRSRLRLAGLAGALEAQGVEVEPVRVDEYTDRRFTFFADPDGLPLELYEDQVRAI